MSISGEVPRPDRTGPGSTGAALDAVLERLRRDEAASLGRLFEVLRIPSVSTSPDHAGDCRAAAEWFRQSFETLGFEGRIVETPGQPAVVAHYRGPGAQRPHVIYYGHYDVQPAEPIGAWDRDPFDPSLVDGPQDPRVVARGAADDKGQVVAWMEAFRAVIGERGELPVDVTAIIEGEEETGSLHFDGVLEACRDLPDASAAVISDGVMWDAETPAVTVQLRGLVYLDLSVTTADQDLHSGLYGGAAVNAAQRLSTLLAGLLDAEGRVAVPHFYDDVREPPPALRRAWDRLDFDEAAFLGRVGVGGPAGERGVPVLERLWSRPTAEINGLWGGFAGVGSKTVIPREAGAKVSFRLVPGQVPQTIVEGFRRFVRERLPADARAEVSVLEAAPAVELPFDSPWLADVQAALAAEFGRPPLLIGCGGSLGAAESFQRVLGIPTLLFSFGLDDDRVHGPNEKFDLASFRHAARAHARLLLGWADHGAPCEDRAPCRA